MFIYKKGSAEKLVAEEVCNKLFSGFLISESAEDKELKKELKDKLAKIKTPEDLKKFMEDNADQIKDSYKKADKKSKPIYKKAWDGLCKAVSGTAGFMLDHIGGVLTLAGVLLVGHKIGWKNILKAIQDLLGDGGSARNKNKIEKNINKASDFMQKAMQAVTDVNNSSDLTKEQKSRIFKIRQQLPELKPETHYWRNMGQMFNLSRPGLFTNAAADSAVAHDTKRMLKNLQKTDTYFMICIGDALKKGPDEVEKVLSIYEKK